MKLRIRKVEENIFRIEDCALSAINPFANASSTIGTVLIQFSSITFVNRAKYARSTFPHVKVRPSISQVPKCGLTFQTKRW